MEQADKLKAEIAEMEEEMKAKRRQLEKFEQAVVYARFFVPGTELAWYPIEGETQGEDFLFFGWISGSRSEFDFFLLSQLEAFRGLLELQRVERDPAFAAGRLTDVVPPPDL